MNTLFGLVGAGGFGREVMPLVLDRLKAEGLERDIEVVFVVETGPLNSVNGHRVISAAEFRSDSRKKIFNVAIGDHLARSRIAADLLSIGASAVRIQAANCVVLEANQIGEGAILCPFATVTSNAQIGKFFHANIYSYVAHDCVIGDFVTLAPGAKCNGRVVIEDHAYIGTGAIIKQGSQEHPIVIGKNSIVGMGAVVTRSVPANTTVIGNPARPLEKRV